MPMPTPRTGQLADLLPIGHKISVRLPGSPLDARSKGRDAVYEVVEHKPVAHNENGTPTLWVEVHRRISFIKVA